MIFDKEWFLGTFNLLYALSLRSRSTISNLNAFKDRVAFCTISIDLPKSNNIRFLT